MVGDILDTLCCILIFFHLMIYLGEFLVLARKEHPIYLESRTPSWAGLWTLRYMPSIYGNDKPTGKPDTPSPSMEEPQDSYLNSQMAKKNTLIICVTE